METVCYIMSSACVNAAAVTVLGGHYYAQDKKEIQSCSKDLIILMFIGTIFRCYWGHSPPEVWSEEHILIEIFGRVDSILSVFIWGALFLTVGKAQTAEPAARPWYAQWNYLLSIAIVIGLIVPETLPFLPLPHDAFPMTLSAAVASLMVELSAIIPQTLLTAHGWEKTAAVTKLGPEISCSDTKGTNDEPKNTTSSVLALVIRRWEASAQPHFVGFLCLGRVFRLLFWLITVVNMYLLTHEGDWALVFALVVPEIVHCVLFGDFLMHWLHQLKHSTVDPFVHQVSVIL